MLLNTSTVLLSSVAENCSVLLSTDQYYSDGFRVGWRRPLGSKQRVANGQTLNNVNVFNQATVLNQELCVYWAKYGIRLDFSNQVGFFNLVLAGFLIRVHEPILTFILALNRFPHWQSINLDLSSDWTLKQGTPTILEGRRIKTKILPWWLKQTLCTNRQILAWASSSLSCLTTVACSGNGFSLKLMLLTRQDLCCSL